MAKWSFVYFDNGGGKQFFKVTAKDKPTAIEKGHDRAAKKAKGNCTHWECRLLSA